MRQAGVVLDHALTLAEQVAAGGLALDAAYRQAIEARDDERRCDGADGRAARNSENSTVGPPDATQDDEPARQTHRGCR